MTMPLIQSGEDQEVIQKTKTVCHYVNRFLYKSAHEPTLASYRIQEHVYKAAPALGNEQLELERLNGKLSGAIFDLNYTLTVLDKMIQADKTFTNIRDILKQISRGMLCSNKK